MRKTNSRIKAIALLTILAASFAVFVLPSFISVTKAATDSGWTLVTDARTVKGTPDLREYVWQKNASMPPNGLYDKIGLHRLVKIGATTKGAVFMVPTVYGSGEQLISNPPQSNYSVDDASSQVIYWANRGFDVYSIDSRSHFLPLTMNSSQAQSFAINWGWDQWISDMKEAVNKTKEVSGCDKIFLAGMGWGGTPQMFYASKYWKEDLKGLILLDGGENTAKYTSTNSYNVTARVEQLAPVGGMVYENPRRPGQTNVPPSGLIFCYQNALLNPGAPAEWPLGTPLQPAINPLTNKTWTNISEYIAYDQYSTKYSNIYSGYGNLTVIIQRMANENRYYPYRLQLEASAIHDWNNCPYVSYDFDDHYKEINVPVLGFRDELLALPTYGNFTNGLATTDFTQITLLKYGHNDVYTGTYSSRDVSEVAYQWMLSHLSSLDVSVFCSVTVMRGWTWWFFAHNKGGVAPYTYQWYEGMTPLQGQTSMVLSITKSTPGVYSYFCRVTDKDGTTTTSNAVTLTVLG